MKKVKTDSRLCQSVGNRTGEKKVDGNMDGDMRGTGEEEAPGEI